MPKIVDGVCQGHKGVRPKTAKQNAQDLRASITNSGVPCPYCNKLRPCNVGSEKRDSVSSDEAIPAPTGTSEAMAGLLEAMRWDDA